MIRNLKLNIDIKMFRIKKYFNFYICFHFRFAQSFIDIREKERKRGTRGLVSVPQNPKIDEKLLGQTNESTNESEQINENPNKFKPEDLIELQEKITKEILSTRLQEEEMHELQVRFLE